MDEPYEDDTLGRPNVQGIWEEGQALVDVEHEPYGDGGTREDNLPPLRDVRHTHPDYQCNL